MSNFEEFIQKLNNCKEQGFDMLLSLIAVDLRGKIELTYKLYSTARNEITSLSLTVEKTAPSVVHIYGSAHFDECEIFDMFGVEFEGNDKLKRLFMPETWVGHPMLKGYKLQDTRLVWNTATEFKRGAEPR